MSLLSGVYGRAARFRRAWYGRHPSLTRQLRQPVISVGNLVVGGSGKTPVVAALARLLVSAGERPAILTRGYGRVRAADGVVVVSDGREVLVPTPQSGDEPQMLARALPGVPVLVSPDRYLAGCLAERTFGCSVHLLDDGFQHVQLARDVNLLVMSNVDLDERLLPSGRLREPLEAAAAADALLVSGTEADAEALAGRLGIKTMFQISARYDPLRRLDPPGALLSADSGRRVVAVAGIARPERFFAALRAEGWDVARAIAFRDHHWFSERDLVVIERAAADTKADLVVTTEKDAMRLLPDVGRAFTARREPTGAVPWACLPLQVGIEPPLSFAAWITDRLHAAREGPRQRIVQPALAGLVTRPDEGGEAA
ncbi:MAG: Tetraacyldisaccharide 4'-kinase [Acidobacteria bacterium]|nr:Tetraacyldisaccharide 4'-kinase [Acidobacteriota bacterium]